MSESRGMSVIRSNDGSILVRAVLFDAADAKIIAGATDVRVWHFIPTTGLLETYDFNDDTFKAGAITTATLALTYVKAENNTYDTGLWTVRLPTLTAYVVGDKYAVEVNNASLVRPISMEFQYGDHEGDDGRNFLVRGPELSVAVSANTITLAAAAPATLNYYNGCLVKIVEGTGEGQVRTIHHYTAARVCHVSPWTTALGASSKYVILPKSDDSFIVNAGMATAGTGTSISLALTAEAIIDSTYVGMMVVITGGTGVGQARIITAYDATGGVTNRLATVASAWTTNPDATSTYAIFPYAADDLVDLTWNELMAGHVTALTVGGNLDALGTALDARTNNANLNSLLGVPDIAAATAGVVQVAGTAGAGSTTLLIVDAGRAEADTDYWKNSYIMPTSGVCAGQIRRISAFTPGTDTITVDVAFTQIIAIGVTYVILKTASGSVDGASVGGSVWDVDITGFHGTPSTAGLLLRVLGSAISTRANNATLDSLLGVPDESGATAGAVLIAGSADAGSTALTIVDAARTEADTNYWHENIVFMTSGPNVGQGRRISLFNPATDTITVSPAFTQAVAAGNTYIIVKDIAGDVSIAPADIVTIVDAVWDEVLDAAHVIANSAAERLKAIDDLTQAAGAGDLAASLIQANKLDATNLSGAPSATSVAGKLNTLTTMVAASATSFVVSMNIEGINFHIETGLEQYGIVKLTPTQVTAQIFDEAGGIVKTIGAGDFGAIGARGLFTYTWAAHTLLSGNTYQVKIAITDGAVVTTTKMFKLLTI